MPTNIYTLPPANFHFLILFYFALKKGSNGIRGFRITLQRLTSILESKKRRLPANIKSAESLYLSLSPHILCGWIVSKCGFTYLYIFHIVSSPGALQEDRHNTGLDFLRLRAVLHVRLKLLHKSPQFFPYISTLLNFLLCYHAFIISQFLSECNTFYLWQIIFSNILIHNLGNFSFMIHMPYHCKSHDNFFIMPHDKIHILSFSQKNHLQTLQQDFICP